MKYLPFLPFVSLVICSCSSSPMSHNGEHKDGSPGAMPNPIEDSGIIQTGPGIFTQDGGNIPDGGYETAFSLNFKAASDVPPGADGLACLDMPGPSEDTWISGWTVRHQGIHHLNVWVRNSGNPYKTMSPCVAGPPASGGVTYVFDSSQPYLSLDFSAVQPDAGFLLPAGHSLVLDVHYYNPTLNPVVESAEIDFHKATSHVHEVKSFELTRSGNLNVAPDKTKTASFYCNTPAKTYNVLVLTSHSHAHDIRVEMFLNGVSKYVSTTWSEPAIAYFNNSLFWQKPDIISWGCTIQNDLSTPITWGISPNTQEMCNIQGLAITDANDWTCSGIQETDAGP